MYTLKVATTDTILCVNSRHCNQPACKKGFTDFICTTMKTSWSLYKEELV